MLAWSDRNFQTRKVECKRQFSDGSASHLCGRGCHRFSGAGGDIHGPRTGGKLSYVCLAGKQMWVDLIVLWHLHDTGNFNVRKNRAGTYGADPYRSGRGKFGRHHRIFSRHGFQLPDPGGSLQSCGPRRFKQIVNFVLRAPVAARRAEAGRQRLFEKPFSATPDHRQRPVVGRGLHWLSGR